MNKNTLSEIALYHGDIAMPKNFEIDRDKLSGIFYNLILQDSPFPFSRNWDMLNTYMRDHFNLKHGQTLINKSTWGNIYKPNEVSIPLLNIDPVDLRNSPDFTFLYGVKVKNCSIRIL